MLDAVRRYLIKWNGIAGAAAAAFQRRVGDFDGRWRVFQCFAGQQISAARAGALDMRGTPDLLRPIRRVVVRVYCDPDGDRHGGTHRLVGELFFAPPLQADGFARHTKCHDGGICRCVIRAVVAVAAGALTVMAHHLLRIEVQHLGDVPAQGVHALAVRPDCHRLAIIMRDGR